MAAKAATTTAPVRETHLGDKVYRHRISIYEHGARQDEEKCHD